MENTPVTEQKIIQDVKGPFFSYIYLKSDPNG